MDDGDHDHDHHGDGDDVVDDDHHHHYHHDYDDDDDDDDNNDDAQVQRHHQPSSAPAVQVEDHHHRYLHLGYRYNIVYTNNVRYRGFHEKGTFSVHSFNDDYLSIPERPGSYKYLFHEIPVTRKMCASKRIQNTSDLLFMYRRINR